MHRLSEANFNFLFFFILIQNRYMSPEILRHSPYSVSADVYSFGVCLWQMITKEVPFAGMTPIQAAFQVANGARPPLTELIPRPMQKIISSCWQQDPQKRPSFTLLTAELCSLVDTRHEIRRTTRAIPKHVTATVNGNQNMNVNVCALPLVMGAVIPFGDEEDESHDTVGLEI
jgi:serine/threonine protein kinase